MKLKLENEITDIQEYSIQKSQWHDTPAECNSSNSAIVNSIQSKSKPLTTVSNFQRTRRTLELKLNSAELRFRQGEAKKPK